MPLRKAYGESKAWLALTFGLSCRRDRDLANRGISEYIYHDVSGYIDGRKYRLDGHGDTVNWQISRQVSRCDVSIY
jgi:hypothetical protein